MLLNGLACVTVLPVHLCQCLSGASGAWHAHKQSMLLSHQAACAGPRRLAGQTLEQLSGSSALDDDECLSPNLDSIAMLDQANPVDFHMPDDFFQSCDDSLDNFWSYMAALPDDCPPPPPVLAHSSGKSGDHLPEQPRTPSAAGLGLRHATEQQAALTYRPEACAAPPASTGDEHDSSIACPTSSKDEVMSKLPATQLAPISNIAPISDIIYQYATGLGVDNATAPTLTCEEVAPLWDVFSDLDAPAFDPATQLMLDADLALLTREDSGPCTATSQQGLLDWGLSGKV
jgi:hypothetical protein